MAKKPSAPDTAPAHTSHKPIIIISGGAKGGVGKTFLIKNLAPAAAQDGLRVLVFDFDTQASIGRWCSERTNRNVPHPIECRALDWHDHNSARAIEAVTGYDIIFIDVPPVIEVMAPFYKALASKTDLFLLPTGVGQSDLDSVETMIQVLRKLEIPHLVVINRVKSVARRFLKDAKNRLVAITPVSPVEIPDYYDFLTLDELALGATDTESCNGRDQIVGLWSMLRLQLNLGKGIKPNGIVAKLAPKRAKAG